MIRGVPKKNRTVVPSRLAAVMVIGVLAVTSTEAY